MSCPELSTWHLAAVVEVPFEDRIQCQCKTCGHVVYKRVHIILWGDGRIECWGQDCYHRELGATPAGKASKAIYDCVGGRGLTAEERELLKNNREQLIAKFREEQERTRAQAERARQAVLQRSATERKRWSSAPTFESGHPPLPTYCPRPPVESHPASSTADSSWDELLREPEGTCQYCGKKTTEWVWFFGKTGMCVCRDCYRQGKARETGRK